ncbi:MAG: hypothetical protein JSS66_05190 [Armatimonadetes bacterium]|nr:hypothetical protein [Armatimonadota bacterium]
MLHQAAEELASAMHRIAAWSNDYPELRHASKGLVKLPPVFLGGTNGDPSEGKQNLVAMVKTLADYQTEGLTLNELPERYASYGGKVKGDEIGTRRIHNWMHQVAFAVRAAMIDLQEPDQAPREVAAKVLHMLDDASLVFVAKANNEYRPLRYASQDTKKRWLHDEVMQNKKGVEHGAYGARITDDEWCQHGVGMQYRVAHATLKHSIEQLVQQANALDQSGRFSDADAIDTALGRINKSAGCFDGVSSETVEEMN